MRFFSIFSLAVVATGGLAAIAAIPTGEEAPKVIALSTSKYANDHAFEKNIGRDLANVCGPCAAPGGTSESAHVFEL